MIKLSVVLATRNEEENIGRCLEAVKDIAGEIIVVDENSTDRTRGIAESFGAKVYLEPHHDIFHITKQKAIDLANGEWILQLDADEVVSPLLAQEIKVVIQMSVTERENKKVPVEKERLFQKHQALLVKRDGTVGEKNGEVVAYFLPRYNMFLGKPLIYGGVYPDGVIRLFKNGRAYLPCKSVHEQVVIKGKVAWLENPLMHYSFGDGLQKYFLRAGQYINIQSDKLYKEFPKNNWRIGMEYFLVRPIESFFIIFFRHKGLLEGWRGFLWALFSASHFPIAYVKYLKIDKKYKI